MKLSFKKIISAILCLVMLLSASVFASDNINEYSFSKGDYVRFLGRGETIGDARCFNWPNAGFEFVFSGSVAQVYADVATAPSGEYNGSFFNVAVYDNNTLVRVSRLKLTEGWNTIYQEQSQDPDLKKIMIVRSSEACRGTVRMNKIRCDAVPAASVPRERLIEFIGDSYTAGYGNSPELSEYTGYCAQNTDNWNSYTGFVSRHYNADNNVIAYQSKGVYANRSIDSLNYNMAEQFEYEEIYVDTNSSCNMSSGEKHKFYKYQPQLLTIWLGTNDSVAPVPHDTFKTAYSNLLDKARTEYPNATILCMAIKDSMYCETISSVVKEKGEQNKFYMLELDKFNSTNLSHPDIQEDQRIAKQIIEKIDSIKNVWNVPLVGDDDTKLISVRAEYNTGNVKVYGNIGYAGDNVSLVVMKPESDLSDMSDKTKVAYVSQDIADDSGDYSFEFNVKRVAGKYNFYINSFSMDSLKTNEFSFKTMIPSITVTSGGKNVKSMGDISATKDITVSLSGFDVPDTNFEGVILLVQYSRDGLECVEAKDASKDSQMYGDGVTLNATIDSDTDRICVFYWNWNTLAPIFGKYDIK